MADIICKRCEHILPSFQDLELHVSTSHGLKNFCVFCQEAFYSSSALRSHKHKSHAADVDDNDSSKPKPIKCGRCAQRCKTVVYLCKHLQKSHGLEMAIEHLTFSSLKNFNRWKSDVEQRGNFIFYKKHGGRNGRHKFMTLLCHRSSCFLSKKRLAAGDACPTEKLDFYCSAFALVKESLKSGQISVECCLQHDGHYRPLNKTEVPVEIQNAIGDHLRCGRSAEWILERLHGCAVQSVKVEPQETGCPMPMIDDESSMRTDHDDDNEKILLAVTSDNISKQMSLFSQLVTQPPVCEHLVSRPVIARQVLQKLHEIVKLVALAQTENKNTLP